MLKFIADMVSFLEGKKTYIVGTLMIVLGFLQDNNQMILEGFGMLTLRGAISKKV